MRFDAKDTATRPEFFTPHALFTDKSRGIHWAALIRPTGFAVYMAILNHAGYSTRTCYPSENTLAQESGLSLPQVKREIKKLIAFGMISKISPQQKVEVFDIPEHEKLANTYTITDQSEWSVPNDYEQPQPRADKGKPRK